MIWAVQVELVGQAGVILDMLVDRAGVESVTDFLDADFVVL